VAGAVANFSGQASSEVYRDLMQRKENCVNFLAALGPLIEPTLSVAALLSPAKAGTAKGTNPSLPNPFHLLRHAGIVLDTPPTRL
jgi:hypothetical protein